MQFLKVLRYPQLALLWSSQVLSSIGDFFYAIAVMWFAIRIAGSTGVMVSAVEAGAALVFGLLGGVYADRWNRRTIMLTVDILRACVVGSLPVLAFFGQLQLWHMLVVALLVGSLGSLFDPALQASLPTLAQDTRTLQAANGLMDVTRRLARALGPSLAGPLLVVLPLQHFFTLDAVSFLISAGAIFLIGRHLSPSEYTSKRRHDGVVGILTDLKDGFQQIRRHPYLPGIFVAVFVIAVTWTIAFTAGIPLYAERYLNSGPGAYGLIVGAYGVGNVISNFVMGSIKLRRPLAAIMLGRVIVGLGFLLMVCAPSLPIALLGSACAALGGPLDDIPLMLIIQTEIPPHHIGKVYSTYSTISMSAMALGGLIAASLYQYVSVPIGIVLCALLIMSTGIGGALHIQWKRKSGKETAVHPTKDTVIIKQECRSSQQ